MHVNASKFLQNRTHAAADVEKVMHALELIHLADEGCQAHVACTRGQRDSCRQLLPAQQLTQLLWQAGAALQCTLNLAPCTVLGMPCRQCQVVK